MRSLMFILIMLLGAACANPVSCTGLSTPLVGIGDSTMHGTGEDLNLPNHNYVEYIGQGLTLYGHMQISLDNRAVRGATLEDMLGQIASKPISSNSIVIFAPGINDAARGLPLDEYTEHLVAAFQNLQETGAKVYVGSIQRTGRIPDSTAQLYVNALDQALKQFTGVTRVPVFEAILATNGVTMQDTCCHPNFNGHRLIAQVYLNAILYPQDNYFIPDKE